VVTVHHGSGCTGRSLGRRQFLVHDLRNVFLRQLACEGRYSCLACAHAVVLASLFWPEASGAAEAVERDAASDAWVCLAVASWCSALFGNGQSIATVAAAPHALVYGHF
jgi:hypothetical protein